MAALGQLAEVLRWEASADMEIDLATKEDLVRGALEVRREGDGFVLDRMNEGLRRFYSDSESRITRARCPACVRIAFRSDTPWIRVALRYGGQARPFFRSDFFCDGERVASFGPDAAAERWEGEIFRADDTGVRDFVIWLPHCAAISGVSVTVADGASMAPVESPRTKWLALGDSITQGMTATSPSRTYVAIAAGQLGVDPHNVGVGGGTMEPEVAEAARPIACDLATVAFGVNDFNKDGPLASFRDKTRRFLENLLAGRPRLPVGVITPLPWAGRTEPNGNGDSLEDFRRALAEVAADFASAHVIDGKELVADSTDYFVDGVHPNDRGMESIGRNLAERLRAPTLCGTGPGSSPG